MGALFIRYSLKCGPPPQMIIVPPFTLTVLPARHPSAALARQESHNLSHIVGCSWPRRSCHFPSVTLQDLLPLFFWHGRDEVRLDESNGDGWKGEKSQQIKHEFRG